MNKKRLTDCEHREIKEKVTADVKDIVSGNVGIGDGEVDDRDEGTGGVSYTEAELEKLGQGMLTKEKM